MTTDNSSTSPERLLELAKDGRRLPDGALVGIRRQLESERHQGDPYTLLHILGKANDKNSAAIVREYLEFGAPNSEDDAMVRRIALQVLGRMWGLPEAFPVAATKAFEEPSPLVRAAAATIIGFLGARNYKLKKRAAALLLKGLDEPDEEEIEVWESFYVGLLELFEVPAAQWPLATRELQEKDMREDLIEQARKLAVND